MIDPYIEHAGLAALIQRTLDLSDQIEADTEAIRQEQANATQEEPHGLVLCIAWPSRKTIAALGAELKQGGVFKD